MLLPHPRPCCHAFPEGLRTPEKCLRKLSGFFLNCVAIVL